MADGILGEHRLSLAQAAAHLSLHVSTLHRWRLRGVRGIRLATILIGGYRYTSHEALERFVAATTAAADGKPAPVTNTKQRERSIAAAEAELSAAGI